jgi:hypothetical protein
MDFFLKSVHGVIDLVPVRRIPALFADPRVTAKIVRRFSMRLQKGK